MSISDNGLNGDLSEEERSVSELGDDGDSMDSDKVGALNLVTSSDRLSSQNNNNSPTSNNNNNNNNTSSKNNGVGGILGGLNSQSNGHHNHHHGQNALSPSAAQSALSALQTGQLSLNQVIMEGKIYLFTQSSLLAQVSPFFMDHFSPLFGWSVC